MSVAPLNVPTLLALQMEPRTTNVRSPLSLGLHSSQQQMGLGSQGLDYLGGNRSNGLEGHARNSSNDLRLGSPHNDLMSNNNNADHIMNSQQGTLVNNANDAVPLKLGNSTEFGNFH